MKAGVDKVMLFGIPDEKDEVGSQAYAEDGIVQRALAGSRKTVPGNVSDHRRLHV